MPTRVEGGREGGRRAALGGHLHFLLSNSHEVLLLLPAPGGMEGRCSRTSLLLPLPAHLPACSPAAVPPACPPLQAMTGGALGMGPMSHIALANTTFR